MHRVYIVEPECNLYADHIIGQRRAKPGLQRQIYHVHHSEREMTSPLRSNDNENFISGAYQWYLDWRAENDQVLLSRITQGLGASLCSAQHLQAIRRVLSEIEVAFRE